MDFTEKMQKKMGSRDYIQALEDERRKILVFSKELPLSLELVTQAIEACRQQQLSGTTTEYNLNGHGSSECSEQTTSTDHHHGPVLEEFIPIKKRGSPDCDEDEEDDDEDEQHSHRSKISRDSSSSKKSDWLRSVQLWNPEPSPEEDVSRRVSVVEVKRSGSGGAFQPFHKEERAGKASDESLSKVPSSSTPLPVATAGDNAAGSSKKEEKEGQRKQRRCWSQDLHKRFLQALQQLGGADSATPKQIRELMKVDGLTNDEVKSHLQKYRLHTRRPSPMVHNNANPQTAPFVLVGNIFVQPSEYAAVATSAADLATVSAAPPAGIYAPVATHPPAAPASIRKPQFKKASMSEHYSRSEERADNNHSEGAVHSNSPASSSSTHTTTNSPGY